MVSWAGGEAARKEIWLDKQAWVGTGWVGWLRLFGARSKLTLSIELQHWARVRLNTNSILTKTCSTTHRYADRKQATTWFLRSAADGINRPACLNLSNSNRLRKQHKQLITLRKRFRNYLIMQPNALHDNTGGNRGLLLLRQNILNC